MSDDILARVREWAESRKRSASYSPSESTFVYAKEFDDVLALCEELAIERRRNDELESAA